MPTSADSTPLALPPGCGDLVCDGDETCGVCPVDCGPCARACVADDTCRGRRGERCGWCAECDTRAAVCGNGACDPGEDPVGCMVDCGPPAWPAPWIEAEAAMGEAIDALRAAGATCPSGPRAAAPRLARDPSLTAAARGHAWDSSLSDTFGPQSCDGRTLADRAPGAAAEALGWGWPSGAAAVASWARGPECEHLLDPSITAVGLGFSDVGGDPSFVATLR